jgi:hypothetical protein
MAQVHWKPIKQGECERVGEVVTLEAKVIYPATFLPETPPRVVAHRCSRALECNQYDRPTCCWAGTLPGFDPFA